MARKKKSTDKPKPSQIDDAVIDAVAEDSETTVEEPVVAETEPERDNADTVEPEATESGDEPVEDADVDADPLAEIEADEDVAQAEALAEDLPETSTPEPTVVVKKASMVPALLGGVICVALGYGAAQFIKPEGWPFPGANTSELSADIDALKADLAQMKDANAALQSSLETATASLATDIETQVAAIDLDAKVAPLTDAIGTFEQRLTTIEARPVAEAIVSPEATAAYERQLADMRALLDSEVARLEEAQSAAQAETAEATAATAFSTLKAAIDSGEPYGDLLQDLEIELPAAITDAAETGVAGISDLQDSFAPAARNALTASSRAAFEAGEQGWVSNFMRTQLGLRSLEPKEGEDVDAVLSRAEADIRDGDFAAALTLIETLPEVGRDALSDWTARASARVAVTDALTTMLGN